MIFEMRNFSLSSWLDADEKGGRIRGVSPTPRGLVFSGVSAGMIAVGVLRVDGALMALGTGGLICAFVALVVGRWNLKGLELHLTAPHRVFAGSPFDLRLTYFNRRALFGTCLLDLELQLSKTVRLVSQARWTAPQSSSTSKLRGTLSQRGAIREHLCLVSSTFPFALFRFQESLALQHEILAFPQPLVPGEFFDGGPFDDAWEGGGNRASDAPGEPRGLRPYQPGDRAKQIDWPATVRALARGRNPRVREYDPPGFRPHQAALIFHSYGTDHTLIRTDLFERALSLACGTLRHLRGNEIPTTLHADFLSWQAQATFQKEAWGSTLTLLAKATRAEHTEAHDLLREIEGIPTDRALVVISDMPLDTWQHLIPVRSALLIDIHQHRIAQKGLQYSRRSPLVSQPVS